MRRQFLLLFFPVIVSPVMASAACVSTQDCPPLPVTSSQQRPVAGRAPVLKAAQQALPPGMALSSKAASGPADKARSAGQIYLVKAGDSLSAIAVSNSRNYLDIARWNGLSPPFKILVGQKLKLFDPQRQQKVTVSSPDKKNTDDRLAKNTLAIASNTMPANKSQAGKLPPPVTTVSVTKLAPGRAEDGGQPVKTAGSPVGKGEPGRPAKRSNNSLPAKLPAPQTERAVNKLQRAPMPDANSKVGKAPSPVTGKTNGADGKMAAADNHPPQSVRPSAPLKKIDKEPKKAIISNNNKKVLKLNFKWPVKGTVVKNFAQAHGKGIDIAGKRGKQSVSATEAGLVVYQGEGLTGFKNLIIIKHNDEYLSAYANNSRMLVKEGQEVVQGQIIAEIGEAGHEQKPLHFEIRKNGSPVNPLDFLTR